MVEAMVSLRNLLQVDSDIHEKIDGVSSSFPRPFCIEQQFATDAQNRCSKTDAQKQMLHNDRSITLSLHFWKGSALQVIYLRRGCGA